MDKLDKQSKIKKVFKFESKYTESNKILGSQVFSKLELEILANKDN